MPRAGCKSTGAGAILIQDLLGVSCMSPSSRVTSIRSSTRQKTHDLISQSSRKQLAETM